jgi:hypothetical protein
MEGFPEDQMAIQDAVHWLQQALTGSLAMTVAVIAIAWFGLMIMSGRLGRERGLQLVLGCFLVFGASSVAAGLIHLFRPDAGSAHYSPPAVPPISGSPAGPPPPAGQHVGYDPYAGAAVQPRR